LTNLFNRRYLRNVGGRIRPREASETTGDLMLDCDHLKDINDTYGHNAGDDSLVYIADVIGRASAPGCACHMAAMNLVVLGNVTEDGLRRAKLKQDRGKLYHP
jgi:GGDEF domain-containing protein